MNRNAEVTYAVDFRTGKSSDRPSRDVQAWVSIPRIARLMALAIRFEGLVRKGTIRDYADLARRGHVTRARMTQIMKLRESCGRLSYRSTGPSNGACFTTRSSELRIASRREIWAEHRPTVRLIPLRSVRHLQS
jgi:hypothetical protein